MEDETRFFTPLPLIEAFKNLDGAVIPSHEALVARVTEISEFYGNRFIAFSTGKSRKTQIFACCHRRTIFNCPVEAKFQLINGAAKFISCDEKHTHEINSKPNHRKQNSLTIKQRKEIKEATINGVTSGKIRLNMGLLCSKDVLYGVRRPILKSYKINEMENLQKEMNLWKNWKNILLIENKTFHGCYIHHIPICSSYYAKDICIVDDTSCTNYYGLPLLVMISDDENGRNQVLSFSFMENRTQQTFTNYFLSVKEIVGEIRLFVCDRNQTQINAIKAVWPNALIIYCLIHIGRNLRSINIALYVKFKQMCNKQIEEKEYLAYCEKYINDNPNSKGANILIKLLEEKEHWLPSITIKYMHADNDTSNRVEGFFGSLKNLIDHQVLSLPQIIRAVYLRGERLRILSASDKQIEIPQDIISLEDASHIGSVALSIVLNEYNEMNRIGCLPIKSSSQCCNISTMFGIPCRHLLLERMKEDKIPLLSLDDFIPRWRHSDLMNNCNSKDNMEFVEKSKANECDWSYSNCLARFERYFGTASKNDKIQNILNDTLDRLSSIEYQSGIEEEILPPPNLLAAGRPKTYPRNNTEFGAPRKKKQYKCRICGKKGHTAPRCPMSNLNC